MAISFLALAVAGVVVFFFLAPALPAPAVATASPTPTPIPSRGGVPADQNESANSATGLHTLAPFITNTVLSADSTTVTVFSFVPHLQEAGGTCTASLADHPEVVPVSGIATIEVAETVCPPLVLPVTGPLDQLAVLVEYSSVSGSGISERTAVRVG